MESGVWEKEWEIPWMHAHLCWDNLGLFTCVLKYRKGTVHYVYGKLQQSRTACPCVSISPRVGTWSAENIPTKRKKETRKIISKACPSRFDGNVVKCIYLCVSQSEESGPESASTSSCSKAEPCVLVFPYPYFELASNAPKKTRIKNESEKEEKVSCSSKPASHTLISLHTQQSVICSYN